MRAVAALVLCLVAASVLGAAGGAAQGSSAGCDCSGDECGCCAHVEAHEVHLNDTLCANITVIPASLSLSVTISVDSHVLVNKTVSLEDPSFCVGVPYLKKFASLCVDFTNMTYSTKEVSGCVSVEIKLVDVRVGKWKLGCFSFPLMDGKPSMQLQLPPDALEAMTTRLEEQQRERAVMERMRVEMQAKQQALEHRRLQEQSDVDEGRS
eukprot:m.140044 g.140044  ORF g.140044 m.140044 type:complete len:209 (-) comp10007_c1_seq2:61-687(-)